MKPIYYNAPQVLVVLVGLCLLAVTGAVSCRAAEAQATVAAVAVRQLAVMPFIKGTTAAQKREQKLEKNLDCQLRGLCAIEEEIFSESEEAVTLLAQAHLRQMFADKIVSLARVREAYGALAKEASDTPRDIAVRLGRSLGVDHVMVGLVWRYQERVGSAMAATDPASVAFTLFLVEMESGKLVWHDSFDKTQTALTENLLDAPMFLKKGMKWLTAEELSSYGLEKMFKKLAVH
jgi:hypothetical protein